MDLSVLRRVRAPETQMGFGVATALMFQIFQESDFVEYPSPQNLSMKLYTCQSHYACQGANSHDFAVISINCGKDRLTVRSIK